MRTITRKIFAEVQAWELQASLYGRPVMPAYCYHVDGVLIDTGHPHARKLVRHMVASLPLERVLLTHYHEDHSGNAAAIAESKHIPIHGHPLTRQRLATGFAIRPYQHYMWGKAQKTHLMPLPQVIETSRYRLQAIHTPGHSDDHMVYYEANQGWLFSGDLFLAPKIRYFRADENLAETIASLQKVLVLDFDALFCAHNPKPVRGHRYLKLKLQFLENFRGKIHHLHDRGYDQSAILRHLAGSEVHLVKWLTLGNVSLANMIKSALQAI